MGRLEQIKDKRDKKKNEVLTEEEMKNKVVEKCEKKERQFNKYKKWNMMNSFNNALKAGIKAQKKYTKLVNITNYSKTEKSINIKPKNQK